MPIRTRVEPIDREVELLYAQYLSPKAQSAMLAEVAADMIDEAKETNRKALGAVPPHTTTVDGREGAPLTSVKPDGIIRTEFELVHALLVEIMTQLQKHSPVLTGQYANSHELFADGVHVENINLAPPAEEYVFLNTQPYARKIEGIPGVRKPQSSQAPEGVYQAVATLVRRGRFGNQAKITFSYRTAIGGGLVGGRPGDRSKVRSPAIIVRLRG